MAESPVRVRTYSSGRRECAEITLSIPAWLIGALLLPFAALFSVLAVAVLFGSLLGLIFVLGYVLYLVWVDGEWWFLLGLPFIAIPLGVLLGIGGFAIADVIRWLRRRFGQKFGQK